MTSWKDEIIKVEVLKTKVQKDEIEEYGIQYTESPEMYILVGKAGLIHDFLVDGYGYNWNNGKIEY